MNLYSRVVAAHVWNTLLHRGAALNTTSGNKIRDVLTDGNLTPVEALETLMGQRKPDVKYFVREVEKPATH
jgi:hypothetical protein